MKSNPLQPLTEIWRICSETPLYEVSTFGQVRQRETQRVLKSRRTLKGQPNYSMVTLARGDGWSKQFTVHVLVARTFIGPPTAAKPDINHIDGDRSNNHLDNLEYVSHKDNMTHAVNAGLFSHGDTHCMAKVTSEHVREIRELDKQGVSCIEMMARYGIERKTLYDIRKRNTWKHVE